MEHTVREAHHDIRINLDTPQPFTDLTDRTHNVHGLRLKYDSTTTTGRLHITVEYQDAASHVFLRAEVADFKEAQRLDWVHGQDRNPHTPRLCECGHSSHAHTVPAPHSCFAFGRTCPCQAYRQLPHDEAVAQLDRNLRAADERRKAQR
jgi:hypothetical protein